MYVAHLGQAKSDAGSGYELDAITAVVLGGTSVFGGRGTLGGTLLGLFALAVLRNGLQLAALPSELTGVLTGTLLVATIAIDRVRAAQTIDGQGIFNQSGDRPWSGRSRTPRARVRDLASWTPAGGEGTQSPVPSRIPDRGSRKRIST